MLGCIEGYYGTPLTHEQRIALMQWMGTKGLDTFAYAPKDDPLHRKAWREQYPDEEMRRFEALASKGREAGVEFCFTISPGLDWTDGDDAALAAKLRALADAGVRSFGILWDDVPSGGAELGELHARATANAAEAVAGARFWTVTTDYAVDAPTPYLEAFCSVVPQDVVVAWTGTCVVPLRITGAEASKLGDALERKLMLWENFPVNDGPMSGVLHLGPYPDRDPDLVGASSGVLFNLMPQAVANRVGVECGARFWQDPSCDREAVWREIVAQYAGLEPLARASRSWVGSPGPSDELARMADAAPDDRSLRELLEAGCRNGLASELAEELAPWLDAWDAEAQAMLMCLDVMERGYMSAPRGMAVGVLWQRARRQEHQVFGIRNAVYPVMELRGTQTLMRPEGVVVGENLTDHLARRALRGA
jgi:hyaluronoglucosaminidase